MNKLWNAINGLNIKRVSKNKLYLMTTIFTNIIIGGAAWLILGRLILPGTGWLFCFMGYPAVFIGFLGGILFLYNHEFS